MHALMSALGVVTLIVLSRSNLLADEKRAAAATEESTVDGAADAQAAQPSTPPPRTAVALRGRWGGAVGIRTLSGIANWNYLNTQTPLAATRGPYTGATITIDHVWTGYFLSGGYRGPVRAASRVGVGIEAQLSGAVENLPAAQTVGTSPAGARLTFSTDDGGINSLVTVAAGVGHVSYNVAPRLNVWGGAKLSALRVKASFGSYDGAAPGNSTFTAYLNDGAKIRVWKNALTPWVGAEIFVVEDAPFLGRVTGFGHGG